MNRKSDDGIGAERLRLAVDFSGVGEWSWNPATDIVELSPRAAEIFGLAPDTVIS